MTRRGRGGQRPPLSGRGGSPTLRGACSSRRAAPRRRLPQGTPHRNDLHPGLERDINNIAFVTHMASFTTDLRTPTPHTPTARSTASSARASTSPLPSQPPTRPGTARFLHLSSAACAPLLQEPSAPSTARLLSGGPPYGQQELDHHRWRKDASARPSGRATLFFICHIINTLCDTITDTWVLLLAISPRPLSMK